MRLTEEGLLLRIFLNEGDKYQGTPLYEHVVLEARANHIASAIVTRGIMGYGTDSQMHTAKVLRLSEDLPVVVEIFDKEEKIQEFIRTLNTVVAVGMMTLEKVKIFKYEQCQE